MVRVCMVAYSYYPDDTRIRREAEALTSRGDCVEVISLEKKKEGKRHEFHGIKLTQITLGRYHGSSVFRYCINYLFFFFAATFHLTILHLKNPFQIIQVHTMPDFLVFTAIIPKLMGAKIILDVHDLTPELYQSKFKLTRDHWVIRFLTWIERCSINFADKAIAVHKPHLNALIQHGNSVDKFIVLLNLPDPKIFSHKTSDLPKVKTRYALIYHGMIAYRHGLQIVAHAISNLMDEISELEFIIIGEGDGVPDLINLVDQLNITRCVKFSNRFVPIEQLVPIILDADVGIVPILYDEFTKYMLPVKLLEYVALGKPVICSRTETIQAYFDDSMVLFFTPGNVTDLTEKILLLYKQPQIREQLIKNSDRFNHEYNWQQQKQLYYQLVDGLIKPD